jgi:hypothetical protein
MQSKFFFLFFTINFLLNIFFHFKVGGGCNHGGEERTGKKIKIKKVDMLSPAFLFTYVDHDVHHMGIIIGASLTVHDKLCHGEANLPR